MNLLNRIIIISLLLGLVTGTSIGMDERDACRPAKRPKNLEEETGHSAKRRRPTLRPLTSTSAMAETAQEERATTPPPKRQSPLTTVMFGTPNASIERKLAGDIRQFAEGRQKVRISIDMTIFSNEALANAVLEAKRSNPGIEIVINLDCEGSKKNKSGKAIIERLKQAGVTVNEQQNLHENRIILQDLDSQDDWIVLSGSMNASHSCVTDMEDMIRFATEGVTPDTPGKRFFDTHRTSHDAIGRGETVPREGRETTDREGTPSADCPRVVAHNTLQHNLGTITLNFLRKCKNKRQRQEDPKAQIDIATMTFNDRDLCRELESLQRDQHADVRVLCDREALTSTGSEQLQRLHDEGVDVYVYNANADKKRARAVDIPSIFHHKWILRRIGEQKSFLQGTGNFTHDGFHKQHNSQNRVDNETGTFDKMLERFENTLEKCTHFNQDLLRKVRHEAQQRAASRTPPPTQRSTTPMACPSPMHTSPLQMAACSPMWGARTPTPSTPPYRPSPPPLITPGAPSPAPVPAFHPMPHARQMHAAPQQPLPVAVPFPVIINNTFFVHPWPMTIPVVAQQTQQSPAAQVLPSFQQTFGFAHAQAPPCFAQMQGQPLPPTPQLPPHAYRPGQGP